MSFQQCSSSQYTLNAHAFSYHAFTTRRNERISEIYIVRIRIDENYGRCRRAIAIYFRRVRKGVSHAHKSYRINRVLFVLKKKSKFLYFCCFSGRNKSAEASIVGWAWNEWMCVWVWLNVRININFNNPNNVCYIMYTEPLTGEALMCMFPVLVSNRKMAAHSNCRQSRAQISIRNPSSPTQPSNLDSYCNNYPII